MTQTRNNTNQRDILQLEANIKGNDYIIGDVHGADFAFKKTLESLKPEDRLFVVGDLTDKGKESLAVIKLILRFQSSNPNQLFIARGNHEDLCLKCIEGLERITKNKGYTPPAAFLNTTYFKALKGSRAAITHVKNGGTWLIKLYRQELDHKKILVSGKKSEDTDYIVEYRNNSYIKRIKQLFTNLPYIIHVNGELPFNVVHADMPFDDETLEQRIKNNEGLTAEEKHYATWAKDRSNCKNKKNNFKETNRNKNSTLSYVGHSVITHEATPSIRAETNTVNIDVAAYQNHSFLLVNHTKRNCQYYGGGIIELNPKKEMLLEAKRLITLHLRKQPLHYHSSTLGMFSPINAGYLRKSQKLEVARANLNNEPPHPSKSSYLANNS